MDKARLYDTIERKLHKKELLELNKKAIDAGYEFARASGLNPSHAFH